MLDIKKVLKIKIFSLIVVTTVLFSYTLYASPEKTKDEKPKAGLLRMFTKEQVKEIDRSQKINVKKRQLLIEEIRGDSKEKSEEIPYPPDPKFIIDIPDPNDPNPVEKTGT